MQVKAQKAKRQAERWQQQLWAAQRELGDLDKLKRTHEEAERNEDETRLFEAIMRLGTSLHRPLRTPFSAANAQNEQLAWVEDPGVLYL